MTGIKIKHLPSLFLAVLIGLVGWWRSEPPDFWGEADER
jgi:hypothetical protein